MHGEKCPIEVPMSPFSFVPAGVPSPCGAQCRQDPGERTHPTVAMLRTTGGATP